MPANEAHLAFFEGNLVEHNKLSWLSEGIVIKVIDQTEAVIDWGGQRPILRLTLSACLLSAHQQHWNTILSNLNAHPS